MSYVKCLTIMTLLLPCIDKNAQNDWHGLLWTQTWNFLSHMCNFWLVFYILSQKKKLDPSSQVWSDTSACNIKALLHLAISLATCLAILLQHKLPGILPTVTYPATDICRNFFVAAIVAKSRSQFYFLQRVSQRCKEFFPHCAV